MTKPSLDIEDLPLRVWQAVGRHDLLQPALDAAIRTIRPVLDVAFAMVRLLIPEHGVWETVAIAGDEAQAPPAGADHVPRGVGLALPAELVRERTQRVDAAEFARRHPGILPHALGGAVMVAVLSDAPRATGLLVVGGVPADVPDRPLRAAVDAMIEPLGSALRHHARLQDATAMREAAEADRRSLLTRLGRAGIVEAVVGADGGLREVMERVGQVARSDAPVLILGETGSGKEVVARAIHRGSSRAQGPFVRVNCGAIPPDLIDSELFGHERGSFTGAVAQRRGWFERADAGTLFLDEVGELSLPAQVRLLRVLQDGLITRVGGEQAIAVDVRVVAATNQDLATMMREGRFRDDLWYRLAVFPIRLPSLRDRLEDLPALATHFAQRAATRLGLPVRMPTDEDVRLLQGYDWPGNIRELSSVIERAAILGNGRRLEVAKALGIGAPAAPGATAAMAPGAVTAAIATGAGTVPLVAAAGPATTAEPGAAAVGPATSAPLASSRDPQPLRPNDDRADTLDEIARRHIEATLAHCLGRVDGPFGAARRLGIHPQTLRSRMKKLGVAASRFRRSDGR